MPYIWNSEYEKIMLYNADGSEWGDWSAGDEKVSLVSGVYEHIPGYEGYWRKVLVNGDEVYAPAEDIHDAPDPSLKPSAGKSPPKPKPEKPKPAWASSQPVAPPTGAPATQSSGTGIAIAIAGLLLLGMLLKPKKGG